VIDALKRAKAVGNDDRGAPVEQPTEGLFELPLGGRVEPRRGFIEDDQPWVAQKGAGKGQQLRLASL
jgi:hypothetical protein